MLGSEGQAWEIVRTSLSLERVGIPRFAMAARMLTRAVTTLKKDGRFVGSAIEQAARAKAACEAARLYSYNIIDQRVRGVTASPEASAARVAPVMAERAVGERSEEHTSELQSLMSSSYAVFCLKKKKKYNLTDQKNNAPNNDKQ